MRKKREGTFALIFVVDKIFDGVGLTINIQCFILNVVAEEDRYIEEGLRSSSKKKTSFYHYEEKFMKCDQTIVIWCLSDFLQRKE